METQGPGRAARRLSDDRQTQTRVDKMGVTHLAFQLCGRILRSLVNLSNTQWRQARDANTKIRTQFCVLQNLATQLAVDAQSSHILSPIPR